MSNAKFDSEGGQLMLQSSWRFSRQFQDSKANAEAAYAAWIKKHPSALTSFERMMDGAKGKKVVVFLDYDGTLSPIVSDPDKAFMSDSMRSAVNQVAHHFTTCIISGRRRDKVSSFVKLKNLYYVGSHGMDISIPSEAVKNSSVRRSEADQQGNEVIMFQPAAEFLPIMKKLLLVLREKIRTIKGSVIEDNKFCLSVHYRHVDEEDQDALWQLVEATVGGYSGLCITNGKMVYEIRPNINWNKGHALEYVLETLGFGSSSDVFPMYLGDDTTDEDAFKVLRKRGQGLPILVSSNPKETKASFSLRNPSEVQSFLLCLSKWKKSNSSM
ncbi:putative trehalose-phosphate phosphatase 6 [Acorus calamus]|uniref:Trehalose 6-phosphate phosphatase n=1 Tax=Acorus calamus TaxID=4465 RepID=A0AAV9FKY4_ACOCL|nr:putative trehalose-phosphate phosphatase 6 [Acorus calamus]